MAGDGERGKDLAKGFNMRIAFIVLVMAGMAWGQNGTFNPFGVGGLGTSNATTIDRVPVVSPATQPATAPSTQPSVNLDELESQIKSAEAKLQSAKDACIELLRSNAIYLTATEDVANKSVVLEEARKNGTPQEKLDASSAWNKSRLAVKKIEMEEFETNESVKLAQRELDLLVSERDFLKGWEQTQRDQLEDAKERRKQLMAQANDWIGRPKVGAIGRLTTFRVTQVIDATTMLVEISGSESGLLIKGFDTSKCADGDEYSINVPVIISGTHQYETVIGGTRTVYVAERYLPPSD